MFAVHQWFCVPLALCLCTALCSCAVPEDTPAGTPPGEMSAVTTAATRTGGEPEAVCHTGVWDSALLPGEFPAPVDVTEATATLYDPASRLLGDPPREWWGLSLVVTAAQWQELDAAFARAGWRGGGTNAAATHSTTLDGAWLSDRHYAYVWRSEYDDSAWLYTVDLAIFPRGEPVFPSGLADWFPLFLAGCSLTGGAAWDDGQGGQSWRFGGAGRFAGVSEADVAAYRQTLAENGFSLAGNREGNGWSATAINGTRTLRVDALFDADCHTLELLYTLSPETA